MLSARTEGTTTATSGRLGDLYLRHADAAARLAYLLTGDREVAEDIVQDAFVRLAGRLAHLRDPAAFDAYLRRTVVNLSHSYWRRKKVERAYLRREEAAIAPGSVRVDRASLLRRPVRGGHRRAAAVSPGHGEVARVARAGSDAPRDRR
jgi:RNA polymerase sigma factor (sigma-70 family)